MNTLKSIRQNSSILATLVALFACLCFATGAFAQSDNTQLSGFVKDPTGAVVASAKVTVTSQSTGAMRIAETNAQGYYVISNLPPDLYTVTAEKEGFKKATLAGKKLDSGVPGTADIDLQVGQTNQIVEVTAASTSVQAESAVIGRLIDRNAIELTELNGRNPMNLVFAKAGVSAGTGSGLLNGNSFSLTNGNFNINGSRGQNKTT